MTTRPLRSGPGAWLRSGLVDRPVIGVTGPDSGGLAIWLFSALGVWMAGGRPVRVTAGRRSPPPCDGWIIGGGTDVDPDLYGGDAPEDVEARFEDAGQTFMERVVAVLVGVVRWLLSTKRPGKLDAARDALETAVIEDALARGLPVLGICRGMQLLNVVLGGDLIQDVRPMYSEHAYVRSVFPRKRIRLTPGSRLASILGREDCRVNALHRQAVQRIGNGLVPVAREPSGVVQAIERPDGPLVLGLQWHPELLPQLPRQRRLFRALVLAAASARYAPAAERMLGIDRDAVQCREPSR